MHVHVHRIRRQHWRVATRSTEEGMTARRLLREHGADVFLPALESAFDELETGESVVHVPRMELHFKVASVEQFVEALPHMISIQAREQLRGISGLSGPKDGPSPWKTVSREEDGLHRLVEYLRTGRISWPWLPETPHTIVSAFGKIALTEAPGILARLRETGPGVVWDKVFFRWFQLVSEANWPALAATVVTDHSPQVSRAVAAIALVPAEKISYHARLIFVSRLAAACTLRKDAGTARALSALISRFLQFQGPDAMREESPNTSELRGSHRKAAEKNPAVQELLVLLPEFVAQAAQGEIEPDVDRHPSVEPSSGAGRASSATPFQRSEAFSETAAVEPEADAATAPPEPDGQFGLAVVHAGLVLLHPFLPRFFETLEIRPQGNRIPEAALPRAAALLHFLATGEDNGYEFELELIKVLLALPPESPLPVSAGLLNGADKAEAEALLAAAVGHWTALKNTSVQALRASFLQRKGLLHKEEEGWRLRVESHPFDVLLGQLPWAFSIVRLPWMSIPIFTEWASP